MRTKICILSAMLLQAACGVMASANAVPCADFATDKSASLMLTHKSIETVQGITAEIGVFEIVNYGDIPIVLGGYRDRKGFSLWHPDAWLQQKLPDGSWGELSDSFSDTLPPPDTLTVKEHSTQQFLAMVQSGDIGVSSTTELRLVVHTQKPGFCIASDTFTQ